MDYGSIQTTSLIASPITLGNDMWTSHLDVKREKDQKGLIDSCFTPLGPLSLYNLPPYLHIALFRNLFLWNRLYAVRETPLYLIF
jgi:hypothetical protein